MFQTVNRILILAAIALLPAMDLAARQSDSETKNDTAAAVDVDLVNQPIAILPFRERGKDVSGLGSQVADLMFASLVVDPAFSLVDREDLGKTLAEAELSLSGVVNPQQAIQIGQITGARLIVTGSVFTIENTRYIVAKIIGVETTRVVGASVKGPVDEAIDTLADRLGLQVVKTIKASSNTLVAATVDNDKRLADMKQSLGKGKRPALLISITESHVGQTTIDPAAQTEFSILCHKAEFPVIDSDHGRAEQARYLIKGEGISEFATRRGDLISVKARLEIKVIDRETGKVVATDRQTRVAVDLVEQIAGKQALQSAAFDIAIRLLPEIMKAAR